MIKLKNILSEAYAWERQEGKALPTLAEVQAAYERKMEEDASSKTHVVYACNVELEDGTIKPDVRISVPKGDDAEAEVRAKLEDRFKGCKVRKMTKAQNPSDNDNDADKNEKPDYIDLDKDGNESESMKDAAEDAKETNEGENGPADKGPIGYDDASDSYTEGDDMNHSYHTDSDDDWCDDCHCMKEDCGCGNKESMEESFNKRMLGNLHGSEYILRETFRG